MMARLSAVVVFSVMLVVMMGGSAQSPFVAEEKQHDSTWTIMVYMADDYASSLNWQDDFNEMEAALQASGTSIIVLVDPFGPDNSALYKIEHDPNIVNSTIVSTRIDDGGSVIADSEVNMADPSTLSSFIEYSTSTFPADNDVLVLWGHGAGWRGLCPDGTDLLTLPELGDALSQATATIGRQLDLVVVDSCAEATLETLCEIRGHSRLFVASEIDVPFQGLPYAVIMNDLAAEPSQSVEEFATKIADGYVLWSGTSTDYSVTMGVFNLSKMDPLLKVLRSLSAQGEKYDPIFHHVLKVAFEGSESYGDAYCVDFGHFMWLLQRADLPLEIRYYAIECLLRANEVVEHFARYDNPDPVNGVRVGNATGLTIFAPSDGVSDAAYANISLAATEWLGFGTSLRNDTATIPNGPAPTVTYTTAPEPPDDGSADPHESIVTMTWPEEVQIDAIWVFRNLSGELVLLNITTVDGHVFSLRDCPGHLTLATSTMQDGELDSYRTVNVTLQGGIEVEVGVVRDGHLEDLRNGKYELTASTTNGKRLEPEDLQSTGIATSCLFLIHVPEDAVIGDLVTIEVIDTSSGDIVGSKRVFVRNETMTLDVDVFVQCDCPYKIVVPLLFALLPGLLILGFALSLYFQKRRESGGKAS